VSSIAALAAFPAAALVILTLLRSPARRRLVAAPAADRWHEAPTPLFGGAGIFVGFGAGLGVAIAAGAVEASSELVGILAGCAILFAAGLIDDVYRLGPLAKVAAQGAAAAAVLIGGIRVELVGNDVIAAAIAVVWLVGMTNAFNLLDNMDGLAATLAAIAAGFFAIDAFTQHPNDTSKIIALSLLAACAGFLPFNLRPGRKALVFMGDSGSQVLGFALAALGLASSYKVAGTTVATLILPILILAVPILDTTLVTVVRMLEGRSIAQGGRDHSSHRLVYLGLSETSAVVLLALVSIGLGGTSFAYSVFDDARVTLFGVLVTFALLLQFASFLADVEMGVERREGSLLARTFLGHQRRLLEVVVDFALIAAAFTGAYFLRFGGGGTVNQRHLFLVSLPILLATRYLTFIPFGLYRSVWRYAGARDAAAIVAAVAVSEVIAVGILALTQTFGDFSTSVFAIDFLLCSPLVLVSRFAERALVRGLSFARNDGRRTLIVGAGRTGRSLLRELRETPGERVVGFLDDDPLLKRRRIQGATVLGGTDEIERQLESAEPDVVLVTIPNAPRERLDAIVRACAAADVQCRFVRRDRDLDPRVILGASAE
jgi:UDP-GlcNAc:undecaprenyl-phosphate/decaprenyl-phosphate GlcNAc-1-phosphate transferase